MNCRRVERLATDYLHGELSAPEAEKLRRHLAGCEPCRSQFEADREMLADIGYALHRPSAELAERTLRAVAG